LGSARWSGTRLCSRTVLRAITLARGFPEVSSCAACSACHSSARFGNRHAKRAARGPVRALFALRWSGTRLCLRTVRRLMTLARGGPRGQFLRSCSVCHSSARLGTATQKRAARGSVRALLALSWSGTRLCLGTVRRLMTPARSVPEVSSCAACSACHSSARFGNRHAKRAARGHACAWGRFVG